MRKKDRLRFGIKSVKQTQLLGGTKASPVEFPSRVRDSERPITFEDIEEQFSKRFVPGSANVGGKS